MIKFFLKYFIVRNYIEKINTIFSLYGSSNVLLFIFLLITMAAVKKQIFFVYF